MKTLQQTLIAISLTFALGNSSFAQDESETLEPPVSAPVESMQTFTFSGEGYAPTMIVAPMVSNPLASFSMSENEDYSFMHDPSVRKDLELVDKQYDKFVELSQQHQKAVQELMPEYMKNSTDPEKAKEFQAKIQALQTKFQESVGEVLLPHQRDRYKQVARQMKMRMIGMGQAMQYGFLAKELDITDGQKEKLQKIQVELNRQLQEMNKKLRAEAKEKSLQVLTIRQRQQMEELIGDEFKQNQDDWREELKNARRLPSINRADSKESDSKN